MTSKLLAIHGIKARLTPYHDHNARVAGPALMERLREGGTVAYVSDAGTPLISDPGYRLVRACGEEGIAVIPLPGASAVMAALCVSGLPTDRFLFAGFPPPRSAARQRFLAELSGVPATLVFMESPRRLAASLADMADDPGAARGRRRPRVDQDVRGGAARHPRGPERALPNRRSPPGRSDPGGGAAGKTGPADDAETDALLEAALEELSPRGAAERVAAETGRPFRRLYGRALELGRGER